MQVNEAVVAYERWLLAARNLSAHTIRAYQGDLNRFAAFAGAGADVRDLRRESLLEFLEAERAAGLAPSSLRRRASSLRGFSRWLCAQGLVNEDHWSGVDFAAGRSRRLPRIVPAGELDRLLTFLKMAAGIGSRPRPGLIAEHPHESTTLLAVALMVATGARVHEVVGFRTHDLDLPSRAIRLVGKGQRERQVYLTNDWITELTAAYLKQRCRLGLSHPLLLFNLRYEPLTTAAMRSRLIKASRGAGIGRRVTPHMLRHTAATQLIEAGVDIRYIQRLLGHASLSTTEIYTHVSDRALRRVVSEADVLGRFSEAR